MSRIDWLLWGGAAIAALLFLFILIMPTHGQNAVPCWYIANGENQTFQCANGYFITTTPEGEVIDGNGPSDPYATMRGAGIITDPRTGNINMRGPSISPATPQPSAADPSASMYGVWPRY